MGPRKNKIVLNIIENIESEYLGLFSGPWTHHSCSSPGRLQFPEEVLQLLPLDVAIAWKTNGQKRRVITTYHKGPLSVLLTCKNPISRCGHSVEQIQAWLAFCPSIDSNMSLLPVALFLPLPSGSIDKAIDWHDANWSLLKDCVFTGL